MNNTVYNLFFLFIVTEKPVKTVNVREMAMKLLPNMELDPG